VSLGRGPGNAQSNSAWALMDLFAMPAARGAAAQKEKDDSAINPANTTKISKAT